MRAHLHTSWLWPERRRQLSIIGERGMLVYDELKQNVILHKKTVNSSLDCLDEGCEIMFEGSGQPLVDCIKDGTEPISSGAKSIQVIKILEEAMKGLNR